MKTVVDCFYDLIEKSDAWWDSKQAIMFGALSLVAWLIPIAGVISSSVGLYKSTKSERTAGLIMNGVGLWLSLANWAAGLLIIILNS